MKLSRKSLWLIKLQTAPFFGGEEGAFEWESIYLEGGGWTYNQNIFEYSTDGSIAGGASRAANCFFPWKDMSN